MEGDNDKEKKDLYDKGKEMQREEITMKDWQIAQREINRMKCLFNARWLKVQKFGNLKHFSLNFLLRKI